MLYVSEIRTLFRTKASHYETDQIIPPARDNGYKKRVNQGVDVNQDLRNRLKKTFSKKSGPDLGTIGRSRCHSTKVGRNPSLCATVWYIQKNETGMFL